MSITPTKIGWANAFGRSSGLTWNFASGCSKVRLSDRRGNVLPSACDNCYAESMSQRIVRMGSGPPRYSDEVVKDGAWTGRVQWDLDEMTRDAQRLLKKRPNGIFIGSMTDLFHKDVPEEFLLLFSVVLRLLANHGHICMLLTKRLARMMAFQREYFPEGFPPNIWPGVTVEHQEAAEARLEILCGLNVQIGGVRWVSMEPLLERVNIRPWLPQHEAARRACTRIGWVVAGCESSGPRPGERHTSLDWVRQAQEECAQAGVPLYVKQLVVNEQLVKEPAGWPQDFPCLS